jgi:hypothetical protein
MTTTNALAAHTVDALQTFLSALFAHAVGVIELRAIPSKTQAFVARGDERRLRDFVQAHAHENIYVGVATRRNSTSGALANCHELRALFVDLDFKHTPEADARRRLREFPFHPSLLIHSGHGVHVYWVLREPLDLQTDSVQARALLRRLTRVLTGDLVSAEPAHVLRLPDTMNYKYDPPRPVRLEHWDDAAVFNMSEFDSFLPEEPPAHGPDTSARFSVGATIQDGQRNATLYKLGRSLKAKGLSPSAIGAAIQEENQAKCQPPLEHDEVEAIVRQVIAQPDRPEFVRDAAARAHVTNGTASTPLGTLSALSGAHTEEWPDISPIKAELAPVDRLSLEIVPAPFRAWVNDVSSRMQCPLDFVAAGLVVMTGAGIGAGCGIRPKKYDDWTVVPNLWGGVVGRPSMLKTPAIGEAMRPLEGLELAAKQTHDAAMKDHEANLEAHKAQRESLVSDMKNLAKGKTSSKGHSMDGLKYDFAHLEEPKPPVWRRYKTNDATIEKMADLQAENPRGLLLFRDELIGLFATWDKESHENDRAFYLESWNGTNPWTTDRIGRGTSYVENLCVSLFGGIQPTKLSSYLYAAMRGRNNDGLVQRLQVLVYPDELPTWTLTDTAINADAKRKAYQVVQRLASMEFRQYGALGDEGQRIPYYRFDDAGQVVFYEWLTELETKLRKADDEPVVLEHLGKYRSLMPALALVFHLVEIADGAPAGPVSAANANLAAAWCEYLESHARRIYGLVTNITAQAAARLSLKLLQGALPSVFTARDVYRKEWGLLDDRQVIENACDELASLGWLRERVTPTAPGQRGKTEYVTNPKVRA